MLASAGAMGRFRIAVAVGLLGLLGVVGRARADGPFAGAWRASPMRVQVHVDSWGPDCPRRPPASWTEPGGTVQIGQSGDQLVLSGTVRGHSNGCWSDNPTVHRVASSFHAGTWSTSCATATNNPRSERGTYTFHADGDDTLSFRSETRWNWQLNQSRCVASRTETRSFTRATPTAAHPAPTPPANAHPACTPGAPVRLVVHPDHARIAPGDHVCFRARLLDAAGCALTHASVQWTLSRPAHLDGSLKNGCFQAAASAAKADGTFHVAAKSGALHGEATVEVHAADLSDLIASHAFGTASADAGEPAVATTVGPASRGGARVAARAAPTARGSLLVPLLGGAVALFLLIGVGVLLIARGRRGRGPVEIDEDTGNTGSQPAADGGAAPPSQGMAVASARPPGGEAKCCPVCGEELRGDTLFCPVDGARLVPPAEAPRTPQGMICPTCRRGYAADARFCPHDSDELVPYAQFAARHRGAGEGSAERTKICPKCGDRYRVDVTFCGKDGAELVLVN